MNFLKRKWAIPFIAIVIVLAIAGYFIFRPAQPLPFGAEQQDSKNATEFEGLEIKIPGSDENGYWELKLTRLTGLDDLGRMSGIQGRYIVNGEPVQFITAERGKILWAERRVTFEKQVVLKTKQEERLTAERLTWEPKRYEIQAQGHVVLQANGISVKTEKLTAANDLKKVTFSGMTQVITQRGGK